MLNKVVACRLKWQQQNCKMDLSILLYYILDFYTSFMVVGR